MSRPGSAPLPGLAARFRRWISPRPAPERPAPPRRRTVHRLVAIRPPREAFGDLQEHLAEKLPDLEFVAEPPEAAMTNAPPSIPGEGGRRAADKWLNANRPTALLWMGPLTGEPLLDALVEAGVPAIAADVPPLDPDVLRSPRDRRTVRAGLGHFRVTLAQSGDAVRSLRGVAPTGTRIEALGPVRAVMSPPPSSLGERDELAQVLSARPTWLAAFPGAEELPAVLAAHRQALRGAHRLLLVVAPAEEAEGSALAARLRSEGWRVSRRGVEGEPDDTDEIFIADSPDEIGLWYRLAPVTFLGGTLNGPDIADPFGPASLGSAIIAGPRRNGDADGGYDALLTRLVSAGGLSRIGNPDELAAAVADLLAPDRAALHAHAAWDVASDAARVQDRLVGEICHLMRSIDP
ncbi:MAG: hypothetical protein AAGG09_10070 [Pseudomonadota bacterium]